jgi:enamine deaminase RidA (YjgF/YER057c/UK114 family)
MAKIEKIAAKSVYDPATYSQAIRVSGAQSIVFVSGQVAYDKKGGVAHAGDFKAQAREAFRSVVAQVKAAGGKPTNIVKLNTYLTDVRYRADLIPIREAIFGKQLPASTLVGVTALAHPDWMIEVEAIAVI